MMSLRQVVLNEICKKKKKEEGRRKKEKEFDYGRKTCKSRRNCVVFISVASSKRTPGDESLGSVIEKPIWFLRDPTPSIQ